MKVGGDTATEELEAELHAIESDLPREVLMTIEEQLLEKGKLEGTIREKQQILIRLLEKKFGPLGDDDEYRVLGHEDPANLDSAIDLILEADSINEVLRPLK
jgi:hypothetical protein